MADWKKCEHCKGTGTCAECGGWESVETGLEPCYECDETGACPWCDGQGEVTVDPDDADG